MKNIQVIDGADNCSYSIYIIDEKSFSLVFPDEDQNIEFIDDLIERLGEEKVIEILNPIWKCLIKKNEMIGLHGTLFYGLQLKKKYYPNKKESDLDQDWGFGKGR
jgi:hypothetical protein